MLISVNNTHPAKKIFDLLVRQLGMLLPVRGDQLYVAMRNLGHHAYIHFSPDFPARYALFHFIAIGLITSWFVAGRRRICGIVSVNTVFRLGWIWPV